MLLFVPQIIRAFNSKNLPIICWGFWTACSSILYCCGIISIISFVSSILFASANLFSISIIVFSVTGPVTAPASSSSLIFILALAETTSIKVPLTADIISILSIFSSSTFSKNLSTVNFAAPISDITPFFTPSEE